MSKLAELDYEEWLLWEQAHFIIVEELLDYYISNFKSHFYALYTLS